MDDTIVMCYIRDGNISSTNGVDDVSWVQITTDTRNHRAEWGYDGGGEPYLAIYEKPDTCTVEERASRGVLRVDLNVHNSEIKRGPEYRIVAFAMRRPGE